MPKTMKGKNKAVENYLNELPSDQKKIMNELRDIIFNAEPEIIEEIKWNQPCYSSNGLTAYLSSHKNHVNLGFYKGARLIDRQNLLEGTGKELRHIKIHSIGETNKDYLIELIKQAVQINITT